MKTIDINTIVKLVNVFEKIATSNKPIKDIMFDYEAMPQRKDIEFKHLLDQLEIEIRTAAHEATINALKESNISPKIRNIISEKYSAPTFEIITDSNIWSKRLKETDYSYVTKIMKDYEALIVVHLPAIYNKKEYVDYESKGDLYDTIRLTYNNIIQAINQTVRKFVEDNDLYFERINYVAEHKTSLAGGYYYIWRIVPAKHSYIPTNPYKYEYKNDNDNDDNIYSGENIIG